MAQPPQPTALPQGELAALFARPFRLARPAVQRGLAVTAGEPEDPASIPPEERERRMKILFNQRARPAPAA